MTDHLHTHIARGAVRLYEARQRSFARRLGLVVRWCAVGCACSVLVAAAIGLLLR